MARCGGNDDKGTDAAPETTTEEPETTERSTPTAEGTYDPELVGSETCRWVDEALDTLREALVDTPLPPELVAHDFETAAGAARQYGHDELADDITALADHLRANGFTGPWASMAFDIREACGLT